LSVQAPPALPLAFSVSDIVVRNLEGKYKERKYMLAGNGKCKSVGSVAVRGEEKEKPAARWDIYGKK